MLSLYFCREDWECCIPDEGRYLHFYIELVRLWNSLHNTGIITIKVSNTVVIVHSDRQSIITPIEAISLNPLQPLIATVSVMMFYAMVPTPR